MTAALFVSYRREDSKHAAGRLAERLGERFELFMDVDSIVPGSDFVTAVREAVSRADVVVAVIGPAWLDARDESGRRRIDQPEDWVATEISTALERGVPLIPVLVDGARMPLRAELPPALSGLADRQAISMTHESFTSDCARLAQVLATLVDGPPQRLPEQHMREDPSHSTAVRHSTVPRPVDVILGRDQALLDLHEMLSDPAVSIVTVVGPGGAGKTRLAIEVAQRMSQGREVEFVPLDVVPSADLVLSTVAAQLQVKPSPGLELAPQLAAAVSGRHLLLVLDNFEHVMDAAVDVARLVHGADDLQLLVTSRESLQIGGEHVYRLGALEPAGDEAEETPAVELFCQRAEEVGANFDRQASLPAIREMCIRLDGLPLAIELAAARTNVLAPDAILQRLERRFGLLTGGTRDAHPRQQSLRACLEWSADLLTPDERQLFAMMAVFAGGATVESLEAVGGDVIPDSGLLTSLGSLVAKSLVDVVPNPAGQRFVMLETVREYAAALLAELGRPHQSAVRTAHARHVRDLLFTDRRGLTGPPRNVAELAKWTAELPNARAAIAFAIEVGDVGTAADLVAALGGLLRIRGEWRELERHTKALLENPDVTTERRLELFLWAVMSQLLVDPQMAEATVDGGLAAAARSGQRFPAQEAYLWLARAQLTFNAADRAECRGAWNRAMEAANDADEPELKALVATYPVDPPSRGDLSLWEQALATVRDRGNLLMELMISSNLGEAAIGSQDPVVVERGVAAGLRAASLSELLGTVEGQARGLNNAGAAMLVAGSPEAAAEHLSVALRLARRVGDGPSQIEILLRLAAADSALGHEELSRKLFSSWYALGDGWSDGLSPSNQRLIDTFLPELWAARDASPRSEVSLSDAVELALRDDSQTVVS